MTNNSKNSRKKIKDYSSEPRRRSPEGDGRRRGVRVRENERTTKTRKHLQGREREEGRREGSERINASGARRGTDLGREQEGVTCHGGDKEQAEHREYSRYKDASPSLLDTVAVVEIDSSSSRGAVFERSGHRSGETGRKGGDKEGGEVAWANRGGWAGLLSGWGYVTTSTEIVVPHKALEVWPHDVTPFLATNSTGSFDIRCRAGVLYVTAGVFFPM